MIVKEAPIRRSRRSSFVQLTKYITEGFAKTGIRTDFASWEDLTQYIVAPSAFDWSGERIDKTIAVEVGGVLSLDTAAYQMHAVATRNPRVTNPVLHLILSWPEGERPETESIFSAARRVLEVLDLSEHQYVVAIHDNTENLHAHLAVNRVHPVTFKAARLAWMHKTLHRAARELEIENGWFHDRGLYEVVEINGSKTIVETEDRLLLDKTRSGASRSETWGGEASLERWCRNAPASALAMADADTSVTSWQQVHLVLASFGLEMRESSRGGICVRDVGKSQADEPERGHVVSLSRAFGVKRCELEERFGPFTPSKVTRLAAEAAISYKRDPDKRIERRVERKALQDALRDRFKGEIKEARETRSLAEFVLKEEFLTQDRERMSAQDAAYRACRLQIRDDKSLTSLQKRQAYMLAKLSHAQVRVQLRDQIKEERALRRELLPSLPTWRVWVEALAQTGDEAAISALRGLVYRERRSRGKQAATELPESADQCVLKPAQPAATDPWVRDLMRLSWKVSSHGLVTYSLDGGGVAFVDAGPKLRFDHAVVSDDVLQLALRYAEQKWGGQLHLAGGDQMFRERVARMADAMGIELVGLGSPVGHAVEPSGPRAAHSAESGSNTPGTRSAIPAVADTTYTGKIVAADDRHLVQDIGRSAQVAHEKTAFGSDTPSVGMDVVVRYDSRGMAQTKVREPRSR